MFYGSIGICKISCIFFYLGCFEFILRSFELEFQKSGKNQKNPCLLGIIVLEESILLYKATNCYSLECTDTIACHLYQSKVGILPNFVNSILNNSIISETFFYCCIIANRNQQIIEHFPKNIKIWKPVFWSHNWDFLNEHHINMHLDISFYMYHVVIFG